MKVATTRLAGPLILEPRVFGDQRGFFMESHQQNRYAAAGVDVTFVQDNISRSVQNTLRGLHYQYPCGQAKLVQVLQGEIYDVAVDIRKGSPTFGQWVGVTLSAETHRQLFIPAGFAHGFCVLSSTALFMYKCSQYYAPENEGGIRWNDPDLGIDWPISVPVLSRRDQALPCLEGIADQDLPPY